MTQSEYEINMVTYKVKIFFSYKVNNIHYYGNKNGMNK